MKLYQFMRKEGVHYLTWMPLITWSVTCDEERPTKSQRLVAES